MTCSCQLRFQTLILQFKPALESLVIIIQILQMVRCNFFTLTFRSAQEHSIWIIWMATSCALQWMFHNIRKLHYWLSVSHLSGFVCCAGSPVLKQDCSFFISITENGLAFVSTEGVGVVGCCWLFFRGDIAEGPHLLCPFPAFHTACEVAASAPDERWPLNPPPPLSLSPTHSNSFSSSSLYCSYKQLEPTGIVCFIKTKLVIDIQSVMQIRNFLIIFPALRAS